MSKTSPHHGAILDRQATTSRRGVTLLEVLIAIGILAVGLTSVVSLVPAGRSQAARAVVLDRAGVLAANALADAATFGLLRPDALTTGTFAFTLTTAGTTQVTLSGDQTGLMFTGQRVALQPSSPVVGAWVMRTVTASALSVDKTLVTLSSEIDGTTTAGSLVVIPVLIDPIGPANIGSGAVAWLRQGGIFSGSADPGAAGAAHLLFAQARDDVVFQPGATADDLPTNMFTDGARAFAGRMTCLYGIRLDAPQTLSVVVFHGRDPGTLAVTGTINNGSIATSSLLGLGDRIPRDILKPGVVCYGGTTNPRFHQAISVSFPMLDSSAAAASTAYVTFSTGTAILTGTHTLTIFPDSVGLAERTFMVEPSGPYLQ